MFKLAARQNTSSHIFTDAYLLSLWFLKSTTETEGIHEAQHSRVARKQRRSRQAPYVCFCSDILGRMPQNFSNAFQTINRMFWGRLLREISQESQINWTTSLFLHAPLNPSTPSRVNKSRKKCPNPLNQLPGLRTAHAQPSIKKNRR